MNIIHHWILYHSVNNFVTFLVISSSGQTVSVWIEAIGCFINELDWKPNWFCHFYIIVIFWTALYGDIIQSSIWFSNIKKYIAVDEFRGIFAALMLKFCNDGLRESLKNYRNENFR